MLNQQVHIHLLRDYGPYTDNRPILPEGYYDAVVTGWGNFGDGQQATEYTITTDHEYHISREDAVEVVDVIVPKTFAEQVQKMCYVNYDAGGDIITECFTVADITSEFKTLEEVVTHIGQCLEQATNARWGEVADAAVTRLEKFDSTNWHTTDDHWKYETANDLT